MIGDARTDVVRFLKERRFDVQESVRFDWLSSRTPVEPGVWITPEVKYRLIAMHKRLGGDWDRLPLKRRQYLRVDIQVNESTLIELDGQRHFSSARLQTLEMYEGLKHHLDLDAYRALCHEHCQWADNYQPMREAPDFPFPGGRTAQIAYFDAVKDLVIASQGLRLIRLPLPEDVFSEDAKLALRVLL